MFGKHLKNSFADLAETLKRLFTAPKTQSLDLQTGPLTVHSLPPLEGCVREHSCAFQFHIQPTPLHIKATLQTLPPLEARIHEEKGWDAWTIQGGSLAVPLFSPAHRIPFEVPRISRKALIHKASPEPWQIRIHHATLARFQPRILRPSFRDDKQPNALQNLDLMFQRPFQMAGIPFHSLPKPLQMRYSLQLVKSTQHNIRSMDILGLFNLPKSGVNAMRFDNSKNRLLLALTPVAARAKRVPFLLARLKDSGEVLSCYPEETS